MVQASDKVTTEREYVVVCDQLNGHFPMTLKNDLELPLAFRDEVTTRC